IIENQRKAKEARKSADEVQPQVQKCQLVLTEFRTELKGKEAKVYQRVRELNRDKDRLQMITREIDAARESLRCPPGETRYPDRLAMITASKDELQTKRSEVTRKYNTVTSQVQESDRLATELTVKLRQVNDNLLLRGNLCDQENIKKELQEVTERQSHLESQLSAIDNEGDAMDVSDDEVLAVDSDEDASVASARKRRHGASIRDRASNKRRSPGGSRLQRRRDVLNAKLSQLTSERAGLQGEVKQLEDQAQRYRKELSTDYKDIDMLYVKQLVQCKTEELANTDLGKYGKALDSAIMQYHSLKMQGINRIIRELWINTYQGNDIDTIEIRSEMEGARNSRSHNYRVVMIKAGHAIDMRGRCSAGQKVLA
ncbi:DNA repair protein rad50, partial [Linderina macrospora]